MKKKCSKCGIKRDIKKFRLRVDTGKRRNTCLECDKKYFRERKRRIRKTNEYKKKKKQYFIDNPHKLTERNERRAKWRRENPEKNRKYRAAERKSAQKRSRLRKTSKDLELTGKKILERLFGKECNKCGVHKSISEFSIKKSNDKYNGICKKCVKKRHLEYQKKYSKEIKNYQKTYQKEYRKNPQVKMKKILRNRIRNVVLGMPGKTALENLGCSVEYLVKRFESMFYPNPETKEMMTWENYGRHGWHVDHIIPLSAFDLTRKDHVLYACHYTNLQPLWAKDNLQKHDSINWKK